jgi:hypothetical protein
MSCLLPPVRRPSFQVPCCVFLLYIHIYCYKQLVHHSFAVQLRAVPTARTRCESLFDVSTRARVLGCATVVVAVIQPDTDDGHQKNKFAIRFEPHVIGLTTNRIAMPSLSRIHDIITLYAPSVLALRFDACLVEK